MNIDSIPAARNRSILLGPDGEDVRCLSRVGRIRDLIEISRDERVHDALGPDETDGWLDMTTEAEALLRDLESLLAETEAAEAA